MGAGRRERARLWQMSMGTQASHMSLHRRALPPKQASAKLQTAGARTALSW